MATNPVLTTFRSFVDRYMPGYIFFGDGIRRGYTPSPGTASVELEEAESNRALPPWTGSSICLFIDSQRSLVDVQEF
jgi:D-glycerate 3-kinase